MADMDTQQTPNQAEPAPWEIGTPEQPAEQATADSNPVDDIVSGVDEFSRIFNETPQQEEAPADNASIQQTAPQVAPVENTQAQAQDNDQVRYQYWQSEADKTRNELVKAQAQVELLQQQQAQAAPAQEAQAEPEIEFPPPPERPKKPRGFNREEAFTDSSSDSAAYLDELDGWREQMDDYNRLHNEYQVALVQEERDRMNQAQEQQARQQRQYQEAQQQMNNVQDYIKSNYNAPDEAVNDFIRKYSSQESVTLDNLWKLYQLEQGQRFEPQQNVANSNPPSQAFEQTKRAQSVPAPMGVVPAANTGTKTNEDSIMDDLIADYNNKNPWG